MAVDFGVMDTPATLWSATASSVICTELQAEKNNIVIKRGKVGLIDFVHNLYSIVSILS